MSEVEQFEVNGYTVRIMQDEEPSHADPRDADNLGVMVATGHRRYVLGDTPFATHMPEYRLAEPYVDAFLEHRATFTETSDALRQVVGATVVLPLWLLDHSGLAMRTGPFHEDAQQWDSGIVGLIFDTERTRGATGVPAELVNKGLRGEVEEYDRYLRGEVYGYLIEDPDGDEVDSCWGFLGSEYVEEEARAAAEAQPPIRWVVVRGNVASGIHITGPYDSREDAEADDAADGVVMLLKPPISHGRESEPNGEDPTSIPQVVVGEEEPAEVPKIGAVPASWMAVTGQMGAQAHLRLLAAVDLRGVDHEDLEAVRQVWEEITDGDGS